MLESLTHATFVPLVGTRFRIPQPDAAPIEIELIEANALPRRGGPGRQEPFSLVFRGAPTSRLLQRIHTLIHDDLGTLEVFLVPIEPDRDGPRYEAIFN